MKKFNQIENIIKQGVDERKYPGAHYCYIEGENTHCNYYGYKTLYPSKELLKGDEIYDIASLSKVVSTTTIILKMIENNKLALDTKVKDILKRYKHENTTIEELLLHISGLNPIVSKANTLLNKDMLINQIYDEELYYEPGSKIVYSDIGFKILGLIIEEIYNISLKDVAESEIFKPLNMLDTSYRPDQYRAVPTEYRDDHIFKGYVKGLVHDERSYLLDGNSGHAGVFSTAADLSKYINKLLFTEEVIKNSTKKMLFNNKVTKTNLKEEKLTRTLGYHMFETFPKTHNFLITHTGFTGCNMWVDFKNKRGFVMLSNAIHPKREDNKVFETRMKILRLFYN